MIIRCQGAGRMGISNAFRAGQPKTTQKWRRRTALVSAARWPWGRDGTAASSRNVWSRASTRTSTSHVKRYHCHHHHHHDHNHHLFGMPCQERRALDKSSAPLHKIPPPLVTAACCWGECDCIFTHMHRWVWIAGSRQRSASLWPPALMDLCCRSRC